MHKHSQGILSYGEEIEDNLKRENSLRTENERVR